MREFPDKGIRSGLDNLITKLLKNGMSKRKRGTGIPSTVQCASSASVRIGPIIVINERRVRLKASVLVNSRHFEH